MAASNSVMIHKLQQAINQHFGQKILYNKTQFYSDKQDRPVTMYTLKQAVWDSERKRNRNTELFSTTSQIQIVLFLRDLWYELNEWEVPTDNEEWNKAKAGYYAKHGEEQVDGRVENK